MPQFNFNKVHKNGWLSFKQIGTSGAVFIDGRMLTDEAKANPPASITVDGVEFVTPGADVTEKAAAAAAKKLAAEAARAEKAAAAAAKANARLEKLQASAAKAQAIVDAAKAKVAAAVTE